jgi:hypothetical protein
MDANGSPASISRIRKLLETKGVNGILRKWAMLYKNRQSATLAQSYHLGTAGQVRIEINRRSITQCQGLERFDPPGEP